MYAIKIRRMPEGQGSSSSSEPSLARSSGVETSSDLVGDWILGEKIGQGSYGRVKLATHKDSGLKVFTTFVWGDSTHPLMYLTGCC